MRLKQVSPSLVNEGVYDQGIFKAVFMAGAPGAGKSTIAAKLFPPQHGLKRLDVDNFWHLYHTKQRNIDYDKFSELYRKQERNLLDGRLGLIIDGTARNPDRMDQVKIELEELGYECAMVLVNTTLSTSLSRVNLRSQTVGRHVDEEFVEMAWNQVQRGIPRLDSMFSPNFYIIDNNNKQVDVSPVLKPLTRWLTKPPTSPIAVNWINNQKLSKRHNGDQSKPGR